MERDEVADDSSLEELLVWAGCRVIRVEGCFGRAWSVGPGFGCPCGCPCGGRWWWLSRSHERAYGVWGGVVG